MPNAKEQFDLLRAQRETIEAELGFAVDWLEMPDKVQSKVASWQDESPPEDE